MLPRIKESDAQHLWEVSEESDRSTLSHASTKIQGVI